MNESNPLPENPLAHASPEEIMSAMFANMVIQQTNMAMMFLGKVPHPETGQHIQDPEAARMFIDQLEMIEYKTRGNLSKQEAALMKQGLTALRMGFMEAFGTPHESQLPPASEAAPLAPPQPTAEPKPVAAVVPPAPPTPPAPPAQPLPPEESRKKFSKKY